MKTGAGKGFFLVLVVLFFLMIPVRGSAADVISEISDPECADAENGIYSAVFHIRCDQPATAAGNVTVSGGVILSLSLTNGFTDGTRFVYSRGETGDLYGKILFQQTERSDVIISISGDAASLNEHIDIPFSSEKMISADTLDSIGASGPGTGDVPAETERLPELPGKNNSHTLSPDEQAAKDASIAAMMKERQSAEGEAEDAKNRAAAESMRAADEARMAQNGESNSYAYGPLYRKSADAEAKHKAENGTAVNESATDPEKDTADVSGQTDIGIQSGKNLLVNIGNGSEDGENDADAGSDTAEGTTFGRNENALNLVIAGACLVVLSGVVCCIMAYRRNHRKRRKKKK